MSPEMGRRFGPYEIQSRLGGGGMGHVYRAWDARLHREVAIKLLQNDYAMPGMRERFLREARAASALNHPNICTIFDIGEQNGDPYLVMELLEGETLRDRIQSRTMQMDEICCIAKETADALGAAHAKGVIHRDVKPANIFLVNRPNGAVQAKVLDFGLAKIEGGVLGARGSRSLDITTVGSTVGTLAYMSPEQARGETLDSRSDLFSLGVVLYEMATRHVPFVGATSALVFVQLLNHPPEPVREWNQHVPRDLEKIINKLLAKERTARFQTAQELINALNQVGEKTSGPGSWLRKAVATVPLVRAADPIARERRASRSNDTEGGDKPNRQTPSPTPVPTPTTPRPANDLPQFLRPVARVPRGETTTRGILTSPPGSSSSVNPAREASGSGSEVIPPEPPTEAGPSSSNAPLTVPPVAADAIAPSMVPYGSSTSSQSRPQRGLSEQARLAAAAVQPHRLPPVAITTEDVHGDGIPMADSANVPGTTPEKAASPPWLTSKRLLLALLIFLAALGSVILILNRGRFRPTMLTERDSVVLTEVENRTGNKVLDGTVADGLQIALRQSPYLLLRSVETYRIARYGLNLKEELPAPAAAREVARRLGVAAYLIGSIRGQAAPYLIHIDLINTASGDIMSSVEENVSSLGEIPGAIDRVASDLRSSIGEDDDSIGRSNASLSHEASSNLDALSAYSQGEVELAANHNLDAIRAYRQAVALDPHFSLAYLRLTTLYRHQRAELAAGDAARLALAVADGVSERTRALAQFEYEMEASGDYNRAAGIMRHYLASAPHDSDALEALAWTLRMQGRMSEALQTAQQSYAEDPYNVEAYRVAQDALIGLDRYDAAFQLEGVVERLGVSRIGGTLIAAYLEGRADLTAVAVGEFEARKANYAADWTYGIYLDNGGRFTTGNALWRLRAGQAKQIPGMESAASFLLAQGALDRALAGDCTSALALAQEASADKQGMGSLFNAGMADALCGDPDGADESVRQLQDRYPQSLNVGGFYIADIKAAGALTSGDPAAALELLKPARQFDLISLTPWLRGRAHVAMRQMQIGIVDFQTVLAHRGSTFVVGSNVYPIAQIGVARAFAETGDLGNSAESYRRFLDLWRNADPGQPLLAEARSHAH